MCFVVFFCVYAQISEPPIEYCCYTVRFTIVLSNKCIKTSEAQNSIDCISYMYAEYKKEILKNIIIDGGGQFTRLWFKRTKTIRAVKKCKNIVAYTVYIIIIKTTSEI